MILINSLGSDIAVLQQFSKEHLITYLESRSDTYIRQLPISHIPFYIIPQSVHFDVFFILDSDW